MAENRDTTCEKFYFARIAPVEATADDYREFFDLLWRTHGETVFKFAYIRLRKVEDARDVCQDAFVRAMQFIQENPGRVPLKVNFRGWLRVIVRNIINDRFRRVLCRSEPISSDASDHAPVEELPEDRMILAEDLAILRRCIEELTERARKIVFLRDIEGLSEKSIAKQVGSNPNAVSVALHRARKSLRECVATGHACD